MRAFSIILVAAVLAGCKTVSPTASADSTSAVSSLDRGSFGSFRRSLNTFAHGYAALPDPTGMAPTSIVERFEVRSGDCNTGRGGWNDCATDRERSELAEVARNTDQGDEYWYGWSLYVPENHPNIFPTKLALGQFHQDKSHPVWMFQNSAGGLILDNQVSGKSGRPFKLIKRGEFTGRWHRIEMHVRWSRNADGFLNLWVGGDQKVEHTGATMASGDVYFKYGVYRSFLSRYKDREKVDAAPTQIALFANVRRAKTRDGLQ